MKLLLTRIKQENAYTIGRLFVDGLFECYTLEDTVRSIKIPGETAIPAGKYKLIIDWSNRFKRNLPHILNVPGFEGIRIHSGNTAKDTEGCLLVGQTWAGGAAIGRSIAAFNTLLPKLQEALTLKEEGVTIEITD